MNDQPNRIEEFRLSGDAVIGKVREIIEEGRASRIILKTDDGRTLIEVPLAVGVGLAGAAVFMAPVFAAIGAIGALAARITVVVERDPGAGGASTGESGGGTGSTPPTIDNTGATETS